MGTDGSGRNDAILDCDYGRAMGCGSFCCRLLVRLGADERDPAPDGHVAKGYLDKDADGFCVHFNRDTGRCDGWDTRPRTCRAYDCNHDPLLQIVLRDGFVSLTRLVTSRKPDPARPRIVIPYKY